MPATIFSFTVVFFTLFGLAILSLRLAFVFELCCTTAFITTICLSSKAASADAELKIAPSTLNKNQQQQQACLRPCKQPEGAVERKCCLELPDACGSSCIKPEGASSGFLVYLLGRIADRLPGHKNTVHLKGCRECVEIGVNREVGRIKGMIRILK